MANENNDDDSRRDLTRIEDLSEFLHVEDNEVDDKFGDFETKTNEFTSTDMTSGVSLVDLESIEVQEVPPELPQTQIETEEQLEQDPIASEEDNIFSNESTDDFNFQNESESTEDLFGDSLDSSISKDPLFLQTTADENSDFAFSTSESFEEESPGEQDEIPYETTPFTEAPLQEKFEEVKNFAQNFSYGQIQGGGNPPFSLVIRNIKYSDDADDILIILRDFGLVTDQNTHDTTKSLELGSLLVPQISEYSAIVLAHKLRRFDCDTEVGLSDEVHPSKSGDTNPRGLMKKGSLRQNIVESYHKGEGDIPIKEIIVSTTSSIEGHVIRKYVGVQTSFAIVDEEELERLKFVQQSIRTNSSLENYETEDAINFTSERAFKDYQKSFELLFIDLCDQLKVKAMKEKANALLGLNYQLAALPFEKNAQGKNCYQLTCTATLAVVSAE